MNFFKKVWQKYHQAREHVRGGNYEGDDRRQYQYFFTGPDRRKLNSESKLFPK